MKKKMAFVDLSNFKDWPMGGMLEYELSILPYIAEQFDVDIWGYSVNGINPPPLVLNGKEYPIYVSGNCDTGRRLIPNFWRGLSLLRYRTNFYGKYDVVYSHLGSCTCALSHLIDTKKTKLVYHQHGLNYLTDYQLRSLIQRPSFYYAQKKADLVFVVSDEKSTIEYAARKTYMTSAKYVSIGSPINLANFDKDFCIRKINERKNLPSEVFLYTGRLTKYKNAKLLIAAFDKYVKNGHSNAILNIAGTGEEFELLCKMKSEFGLDKNVNLLGFVPHNSVYKLLKEADVFLTASGGEGCSVSVLEAFASGLPVICGRMPGLEGQIENHRTGLFVKDMTAESFFVAMEEMNTIRCELAMNCLVEAEKYGRNIIAQKIIDNINSLF